jgi:hypothetical protein
VVKSYLARRARITGVILCSANHDLDEPNPEGEKIARWVGGLRELSIACDGDSLAMGDTLDRIADPVRPPSDLRHRRPTRTSVFIAQSTRLNYPRHRA